MPPKTKLTPSVSVQNASFSVQLKAKVDRAVQAAYEEAEKMAKEFLRNLILKIKMQDFDHLPLDKEYVEYKVSLGRDHRILISSQQYIDSLTVQVEKTKDGIVANVIPPDTKHPHSQLTFAQLAKLLEYGSSTMPARPHWRPLRRLMFGNRQQLAKKVGKKMTKAFK